MLQATDGFIYNEAKTAIGVRGSSFIHKANCGYVRKTITA